MILILIFSLFALSISIVGFSLYTGISPMPSSSGAKHRILAILNEKKNCKDIYELGSGWGTLIFPIARQLVSSRIFAFEISPLPWFISIMLQKILRLSNLTIYRKNFFSISLREADTIVCYLYPGAMRKLKTKFEKELKPGSWVITNSFTIPGWIPTKHIVINDLWKSEIYLYQII